MESKIDTVEKLLDSILWNKNGYKLGEEWQLSPDAPLVYIPILRTDSPLRNYKMAQEVCMELKDSGEINRIIAKNTSDEDVFVRIGTVFTGHTQSRASESSVVIEGEKNEQIKIPVRCVYASKGIESGSMVEIVGISPHSVTATLLKPNNSMKQSEVWSSVNNYVCSISDSPKYVGVVGNYSSFVCQISGMVASFSSMSNMATNNATVEVRTDNLVGVMKAYNKTLDEFLKKIPIFPLQAGAVFLDEKGFLALECYDHPDSWEVVQDEVLKKHGESLYRETLKSMENKGKPSPNYEEIKKACELNATEKQKGKRSITYALENEKYLGEYTKLNDEIIHFILVRK